MEGERTSYASHVFRHGNTQRDRPIFIIRLLDRQSSLARDTVRVTRQIHITCIRPRAISAPLLDSDRYRAALSNRRDGLVGELVLCVGADVDVACERGSPALIDDVGGNLVVVNDIRVGGLDVDL